MNKLRLKLLKRDRGRREWGNTFVFVLFMFPVILGCFGVGVDTIIAQYTRSTLQADLDAAVQSAISQSNPRTANTPTAIAAEKQTIYTSFKNIYAADRLGFEGALNSPTLLCQGTKTAYAGGAYIEHVYPTTNCGYTVTQNDFSISANSSSTKDANKYVNTFTVSVTEYSQPMFLQILGIQRFTYHLTSTAHLAQAAYVKK